MKLTPLLLAASLTANATLLTLTWRAAPDHPGAPAPAAADSSRPGSAPSAGGEARLSPAAVAAFTETDPAALRDLLRASGLPDELIRSIVQLRLWKKYEDRFKAISPQPAESAANQAWWKDDRNQANGESDRQTKAQREESRRLQRELTEESERLLGAAPSPSQRQSHALAFLPAEKRQALQQIQQDYQDLINEVQQETQGFRLPSDAEKLRFLQAEQKRDLEALMTPEERQTYELRQSATAQRLRAKMTQLDATEQEYLAIFPLQKAFDEKYHSQNNDPFAAGPERDQAYWKERRAADAQLQAQIKAVVGEARYADSIRQQDHDWRQLEAATRRLILPADTPARLYGLRDSAASAAQQIAQNPNLATDQKKQALAELAAGTREQVRTHLGQEGADAYFKNNGMRWLKELEKGNTVSFHTHDANWDSKGLPKEPQKKTSP